MTMAASSESKPVSDMAADERASSLQVCKAWKQMIDTSPSLQKGLFFRPTAKPTGDSKANRIANPMMYHIVSDKGFMAEDDHRRFNARFGRRSWQNMFMCQPPVDEVEIPSVHRFSVPPARPETIIRTRYVDSTGVKIGAYGARGPRGIVSLNPPGLEPDSDASWARAETPAHVLQLLGVETEC
ncbi:uncharacterized protein RHO25_012845 [Cercospora beticola]|uniref:F-box domain-containing protein n=1 Tax=Cercospora beticola TaxID=122368 RepID=A0ABZ0P948_CERBT|nr:hypothetical protein RHO25_012845 [Cercospora beticola]